MIPDNKGDRYPLSGEVMNDNNADYEVVESIAARSLANLFKDRTVTGTAYVIYDDKNDSDLAARVYVVVTACSKVDGSVVTPPDPTVDGYTTHVSKVDGSEITVNAVASESAGNVQSVAINYLKAQDYTDISATSNTALRAVKDGVTYNFTITRNEAKVITYTNNMGGEWVLKGDKYAADGETVNVYVSHPTWTGSSESDKRTFNYTGAASGNSGAKLPSNGEASFQVVIADADQALAVTVS